MEQVEARGRLVEELLRHAGRHDHPSHQVLDRVERSLATTDGAEAYLDVLLSASATRYPSLRMLDRAERIVQRLELADAINAIRAEAEDQGQSDHRDRKNRGQQEKKS